MILRKKGNTRGQSSLQTDLMTFGRLPLLKKKNSLDWITYLAATWAAELQHLRTQQKITQGKDIDWWNFLSVSLNQFGFVKWRHTWFSHDYSVSDL